MKNNIFLKLIRDVLKAGFAEQDIVDIRVMQNFQGKKTATPEKPTIVIHRVGDRPVGWQSRKASKFIDNYALDKLVVTEKQGWITTFQINAFVPRKAPELETIDDYSSDDLLRIARMLLQGRRMLDACKKAEFGILPASALAPNWVQDEHDNWINEPSFNLEITSVQRIDWTVDRAYRGDVRIERV